MTQNQPPEIEAFLCVDPVETAPTRWDEAYNSGKSTQVPTGRVIGVRGRVRRKISYNGFPLKYERVGPTPR